MRRGRGQARDPGIAPVRRAAALVACAVLAGIPVSGDAQVAANGGLPATPAATAAAAPTTPTATPAAAARRAAQARDGEIFSVGAGEQKLQVVRRGDRWSLHAENLSVSALMTLWREAGGPEVTSKLPIEQTTVISVHDLAADRIVERLLDGYGYTLHYDGSGRLAAVRVYSPTPSLVMKTPRLAETLGQWRERENPRAAAPATQPGAAPQAASGPGAAPQAESPADDAAGEP